MEYAVIEKKLATDKVRAYLWSKINTPEKIIAIEKFVDTKVTKISEYNYEFYFGERFGFMTFIPEKAVNLTLFVDKDSSLAWFEIKGEENCEIVHGTSVRVDDDDWKWYKENKTKIEEHFLEELEEIAK